MSEMYLRPASGYCKGIWNKGCYTPLLTPLSFAACTNSTIHQKMLWMIRVNLVYYRRMSWIAFLSNLSPCICHKNLHETIYSINWWLLYICKYICNNKSVHFCTLYFVSHRVLVLKNYLRYTVYSLRNKCWKGWTLAVCTLVEQWMGLPIHLYNGNLTMYNAKSPRGKHPVNNHNPLTTCNLSLEIWLWFFYVT